MTNTAEVIKFPEKEPEQEQEPLKVAQLEDGYTRIANELLEAAISHSLTLRQLRVLLAVIRKTYGFNKKADVISGSQIAEITKMTRQKCSTALCVLVELKIINRASSRSQISINKNLSEWLSEPKTGSDNQNRFSEPKSGSQCEPKTGSLSEPKSGHTKDKKDTLKDKSNYIDPKPQKVRVKKPEAFKNLFSNYPAYRKGGTDAQAWKAWKSENLTDHDAELACNWLSLAAKVNTDWKAEATQGFALGITKFIREKKWLTPIPQSNSQYSGNRQSVSDHNQNEMNEFLASKRSDLEVTHEH